MCEPLQALYKIELFVSVPSEYAINRKELNYNEKEPERHLLFKADMARDWEHFFLSMLSL